MILSFVHVFKVLAMPLRKLRSLQLKFYFESLYQIIVFSNGNIVALQLTIWCIWHWLKNYKFKIVFSNFVVFRQSAAGQKKIIGGPEMAHGPALWHHCVSASEQTYTNWAFWCKLGYLSCERKFNKCRSLNLISINYYRKVSELVLAVNFARPF